MFTASIRKTTHSKHTDPYSLSDEEMADVRACTLVAEGLDAHIISTTGPDVTEGEVNRVETYARDRLVAGYLLHKSASV